MLLHGKTIFR